MANEEEFDCSFADLLETLKGGQFRKVLAEHKINTESLKHISGSHLDNIIPTSEYGPRIIFEYHLKKWQQCQNQPSGIYYNEDYYLQFKIANEIAATASNLPQYHLSFPQGFFKTVTDLPERVSNKDFGEVSIEQILKKTLNGQNILKFYENNNALDTKYRRLLANCVIEYLLENEIKTCPKLFEQLAKGISNIFPTECSDIYYIRKNGRKPAGSLYCKYHNSLAKLRRDGLWILPVETILSERVNEPNVCDTDPGENNISSKEWLKFNVEPIEEIMVKWNETFGLRRTLIRQNRPLCEILVEWPLFKQSFGYKLILSDFLKMYPGNENLLFNKWEEFLVSILKLLEKLIKNPISVELIRKLKDPNLTTEHRASIILHVIHDILKPSVKKCILNCESKKRKFSKPTINDSRNAFLVWAPTTSELNSKIKLQIDTLYKFNETLQPILCAIGISSTNLTEFFVYYADIFYKLPNLVFALDVAFKTFHVLDLKYPKECQTVWRFFQTYIYEIPITNTEKDNVLVTVLNDIRNI